MKVCQESLGSFVIIVFKPLNNVILTELKIENNSVQIFKDRNVRDNFVIN